MTSGGGEVPRAMLMANAWSHASRESIGDGGSSVSAVRCTAASCSRVRHWWWSLLTWQHGKGCSHFLKSHNKDLLFGECACQWHNLVDTAEGTRLHATAAATLALHIAGVGQEEHLALGVLAGKE
jgi:hypothetical protein